MTVTSGNSAGEAAEFTARQHLAGLHIEGLVLRVGGRTAVDNLTLHAPIGAVTGLIGPRGAGKSTTFDACSGLMAPAEGHIDFDGHDLTMAPRSRRAELGIGRSFQQMELFDNLTVRENVELGREARFAGTSPFRQLLRRRGERATVQAAARWAMELCGISDVADERAGRLPLGRRRLVSLARAIAGDFRLLLLDDPAADLNPAESDAVRALLLKVVKETGAGILIVESDWNVIAGMCDYIYVLDQGRLISEGEPLGVLAGDFARKTPRGTATRGIADDDAQGLSAE